MTNHLRAIDIKEYAKALDVAKEFADRAEKAEAERDELRAQVQRVVDLHWPRADAFDDRVYTCGHCGRDWPCPTNRALNGGNDD